MSEQWYYVQDGKRVGPVPFEDVNSLYREGGLGPNDYVWRKGFQNWAKIQDVSDFQAATTEEASQSIPAPIEIFDLTSIDRQKKVFFIKTGADRGGSVAEYGPFSIELLIRLFQEKRINGKTLVFTQGMSNWEFLAEVKGFEDIFNEEPPVISESERRTAVRKPFIARMFIQNQKNVFEGICRDISIGGMQVLVDHFPGKSQERININVHPENTDHHFVASGEIVRILEGGQGFSFRFIDLSEEALRAIDSYIKQS